MAPLPDVVRQNCASSQRKVTLADENMIVCARSGSNQDASTSEAVKHVRLPDTPSPKNATNKTPKSPKIPKAGNSMYLKALQAHTPMHIPALEMREAAKQELAVVNIHNPEEDQRQREVLKKQKHLGWLREVVVSATFPLGDLGGGRGGFGATLETALPVPQGWQGQSGRSLFHTPVPGTSQFCVLQAELARQKKVTSQQKEQIKRKQDMLNRLTLTYNQEGRDFAPPDAHHGLPAGAPFSMPVHELVWRLKDTESKLERLTFQQNGYRYMVDRTFANLNEVKIAVDEKEKEASMLAMEENIVSQDLNNISCKAQEAVLSLQRVIQTQEEQKREWARQREWARGMQDLMDEGLTCALKQTARSDQLVMEMELAEIGERADRSRLRVPALYVEAMQAMRTRRAFTLMNEYATKLRQHTGVSDPMEWVQTITDKLGPIKQTVDGTLEPSSRFMLESQSKELINKMEKLKMEKVRVQEKLVKLQYEEAECKNNEQRMIIKADDEHEGKQLLLEVANLQDNINQMHRQECLHETNCSNTSRWIYDIQNALLLILERLNSIQFLGPPVSFPAGQFDPSELIPLSRVDLVLQNLGAKFSKFCELQIIMEQHEVEQSRYTSGSGEYREVERLHLERLRRLLSGGSTPGSPSFRTHSGRRVASGGASSSRNSSVQSRGSSSRSHTSNQGGDEQSLLAVREDAITVRRFPRTASALALVSHLSAAAPPLQSLHLRDNNVRIVKHETERRKKGNAPVKDQNSDEDEDGDDGWDEEDMLTRQEIKYGKEAPAPKRFVPKKTKYTHRLRTRAADARVANNSVSKDLMMIPGWRARGLKNESARPSWDKEPVWNGDEEIKLDHRGRLMPCKGTQSRPLWEQQAQRRAITAPMPTKSPFAKI